MNIFFEAIKNNFNWTIDSISFNVPWFQNYFWGLVVISLVVWVLEISFPWRKKQGIIRKDFFLDGFYMFFNFFLFSIAISGFYALFTVFFQNIGINMSSFRLIDLDAFSKPVQLLVFFVLLDFVQWITHVALHRFTALWRFHKIHHSVKEMGFAAHLRYHWMENIFYKPLKTFAVMLLGGFEPEQAYVVHFIAITIGHFNHANLKISWGPLKYLINNPVMHLYHHAYELPKERAYGANFGISLSLWDYIFKTNYVPESSGDLKLGFKGDENIPHGFIGQLFYGFKKKD